MLRQLKTIIKHRWLDASDTRRAIAPPVLQRLQQGVCASEQRHTGELRICVEASLPASYLWRHGWHGQALHEVIRQRAVMLFGKLRIWDTERNNGVLIYLLLAEHAIELVADRGLNQRVAPEQWQAIVQRLGTALHTGRYEEGLLQATAEVSALLERHFPAPAGLVRANELPNVTLLM